MRVSSKLASAALALIVLVAGCSDQDVQSARTETSQAPVVPAAPTPLHPTGWAGGAALLFDTDAELTRDLDAVIASGSTRLRLDLAWPLLEPSRGTFTWTLTDRVVDAAHARGLDVLGIIDYSPAWAAQDASLGVTSAPANPQEFADFAGTVAQHYKGKVSTYEIWNEPNGTLFWKPAPNAEAYSKLLIASYKTIKAADPSATVIGGVLGAVADGPETSDGLRFLKAMFAAGVHGSFDALSVHPYTTAGSLIAGTGPLYPPLPMLAEMRRVMVDAGDADKKIWATEFGGPTVAVSGGTEDQQAKLIHNFVQQWSQLPWAGPLYIHEIRDRATGSSDVEANYGLLRTDFSKKPAYTALTDDIESGVVTDHDYRSMLVASQARPQLGEALTPVFHGTEKQGTTYAAQQFLNGVLFQTQTGYYTSPQTMADAILASGYIPVNDALDGQQDLNASGGMRVFYTAKTGVHIISGKVLDAWTPSLGFPTSDQVFATTPGSKPSELSVTFENGTITWVPGQDAVRSLE